MGVPIIDLHLDEAQLVAQVRQACSRWGFFQVVNHGVDPLTRNRFERYMREFFALPVSDKMKVERSADNARGYVGREKTASKWDHKECFDVGNCADWAQDDDALANRLFQGLNGVNRFPAEHVLPGFKDAVRGYFKEMESLSQNVGSLMALGMGAPRNYFVKRMSNKHTSHLRLNHYPEEDAATLVSAVSKEKAPFGVGPHTDSGFLTVLAQDEEVQTLEVHDRQSDQWVSVTPVPDAFTINTGDLCRVFSNGLYHAPLHRVKKSSRERFSAPYFYNPSYATVIEPIDALVTAERPALFEPLIWGYFRAMRVMNNFGVGDYVKVDHWKVLPNGQIPEHVQLQHRFTSSINYEEPFDIEVYERKLKKLKSRNRRRNSNSNNSVKGIVSATVGSNTDKLTSRL